MDGLTPALAAALYGHASTVMRILHWQVGERRELEEAHNRQKLEEDAAEGAILECFSSVFSTVFQLACD